MPTIEDQIGLPPSSGMVYARAPVVSGYPNRGYTYANNGSYVVTPDTPRNVIQITPQQQQAAPMMPMLGGTLGTIPETAQFQMGIARVAPRTGGPLSSEDRANELWNQRFGSDARKGESFSTLRANRVRLARQEAANRRRELIRKQEIVLEEQGEALDAEADLESYVGAIERNLDGALGSLLSGPKTVPLDSLFEESVGSGLGVGNLDAMVGGGSGMGSEPEIHTEEQAAAATNQEEVLDEEERTELDKYNHPLSDEWVKKLPPYDEDLKPAEMCVRDCKERTRIHDLECDEVRRRVTKRLNDLGCLTRWVAIPQKSPCS